MSGADTASGSGPRTILVVDDDASIRETVGALLEDEGFAVVQAANGLEALRVLGGMALPDLALVDLRMPIMDGAELIEALRRDARLARLPVVIFSAASTAQPPSGIPLLRKPVGVTSLLDAVHAHARAR